MNQKELQVVLEQHQLWIDDRSKGRRANLSRTDLRGANLREADLYGANLRGAKNILHIGPCGSRGDLLIVNRHEEGAIRVYTGCFGGTLEKFKAAVSTKAVSDPHRLFYESLYPVLELWVLQKEG